MNSNAKEKDDFIELYEFLEEVDSGGITSYDGWGLFVDLEGKVTDISCMSIYQMHFKDVAELHKKYSGVEWYNK